MKTSAMFVQLLLLVVFADAQVTTPRYGNVSVALISSAGTAVECRRPADCRLNEVCIMPDFDNGMPLFWPICEHYGTCACRDGTVRIENGTCLPSKHQK